MPRKLGNLWQEIASYDNLLIAWKEVKQRKSTKTNILRYESNLAVNLSKLEHKLQSNTYKPRPHFEFKIYDPKPRLIQAPHLEDRIVQHAICNAIRIPIQKKLIYQTYSCLLGRGTHKCSEQLSKYLQNERWQYYLSLDISKFFYSIDHEKLYKEVKKHIKCKKTLNLLWQFITVNNTGVGIPIGASTSQIMANLALNPLDHYAKRDLKLTTYLRYCDDILILFETSKEANSIKHLLDQKIQSLGFQLNSKSSIGFVNNGIDWVGYRHWKTHKIIRKRSLNRLRRKAKKGCNIETTMAYLSHSKRTASVNYVSKYLWNCNPSQRPEIWFWLKRHICRKTTRSTS